MNNQQNRRNNFGWLFWIVALFFFQVACSIELTDEEKKSITGTYLSVSVSCVSVDEFSIDDEKHIIRITNHDFKLEKHTDEENLKKFSSGSLVALYYLKSEFGRELVVMSDGSLQIYFREELSRVFYKIEKKQKEEIIPIDKLIETKSNAVGTMIDIARNKFEELETLVKEVDALLGEDYYRVSILNAEPTISKHNSKISTPETLSAHNARISIPKSSSATEKLKQKLPIITCCIILIIVVIFLCVQCCQSCDEPNIENLAIEQLKTNDLSNHYPSSTDFVIDVKETESMQSIPEKINPSTSISTISSGNMKINSSSLFVTVESIGSEEIHESKSTHTVETNSNQSVSTIDVKITDIERNKTNLTPSESLDLVVTKPKATQSESKEKPKNTNDTNDFTI